jgi:hypothetical protein
MNWITDETLPPMSDKECRGIYKSEPLLIKRWSGNYVVGYVKQYEGYDTEWIVAGRDSYVISDVEKWAHIED